MTSSPSAFPAGRPAGAGFPTTDGGPHGTHPAAQAAYRAFVTNAADGTVSTIGLDAAGVPTALAVSEVGPGCSTLVVDPRRDLVHVGVKGEPAGIVTTRIEADGSLTPLSKRELSDAVHYLTLTPDGATLLVASYGGGFGATIPLAEEGLGEVSSRIEHPNIHSCIVDPSGKHAYFASLGADLIAQCALAGGRLEPLDPPSAAAPAGSGPRHLAMTRAGDAVYVMTEFSGEILHYRRDEMGRLTFAGSAPAYDPGAGLALSRFGADPKAGHLIWGADLHLSADERVLWASERSASTLATVPREGDGSLSEARQLVPAPAQPRGFGLSRDGLVLLCAGEESPEVVAYAVNPQDGTLSETGRCPAGAGANWVRFG